MSAHQKIALFKTILTVLLSASYLFYLLRYEFFKWSFFDLAASAIFDKNMNFDLKTSA